MWFLNLIFVILNMFAAPGYLSVAKIETDTNIVILGTVTTLLPAILIIIFPEQVLQVLLGQIIYTVVGVYLTANT